jgi:hypothetical protein
MRATTIEAAVAEQYVSYPFPPRDPADEARRLVTTTLGGLARVSDLLWDGRRVPDTLRLLDAGWHPLLTAAWARRTARISALPG